MIWQWSKQAFVISDIRMNLAIDIGNTRLKIGLFKGRDQVGEANLGKEDWTDLKKILNVKGIERTILSSTSEVSMELETFLEEKFDYIRLTSETPLPLINLYRTPKTLGKDRLAGIIGAKELFPNASCLVIDTGTCITYDLINQKGSYLGGNISPGITMRLKAMSDYTFALPLVEKENLDSCRGYDTETAIRAGAVWGVIHEINGFIEQFSAQAENLEVIITGGDARLIQEFMNREIRLEDQLVLIGLNKILCYNA
ncbi:MAG: type III pantothenate kinase [Saprospiraceae bacterium]